MFKLFQASVNLYTSIAFEKFNFFKKRKKVFEYPRGYEFPTQ